MIVYSATKQEFLRDNNDRDIDEVILRWYSVVTGRGVSPAEKRSWKESLGFMSRVLSDEEIPADAGVAIEYHIPLSSKRLDLLVAGFSREKAKSAVIIELKQWSSAEVTSKDAIVKTFVGGGIREEVHPSYQAWSYAELIRSFNAAVYEGEIGIAPCAYLHNYERDGAIDDARYDHYTTLAPLFLKGETDRIRLRSFIKDRIHLGGGLKVIEEIEAGPIRPSQELASSVAGLLKGNAEFVLLDDQKRTFEAAKAAAMHATSAQKRVVIIEGGPGTGKSVVAVNLLSALLSRGMDGRYVSKNAAPRRVYEAKLARQMTATRYRSLFVGSGGFIDAAVKPYDFLVVDEAHRLNEKSGLYGNQGDHQVREIIRSSHCAVFFIDEDQRVTLKDIGTKEVIKEMAGEIGAEVEEYVLQSQFRCAGSDSYIAWLDDVLGIRETANQRFSTAGFDFQLFDSPEALHEAIEAKNATNRARVVAGYCWPWKSKSNPAAIDIEIGSYRRQWNLDQDGSLWIIAKDSIDQVGCIHTCQGLEVDYVGVIIGPDLIVQDGEVVAVPTARSSQDQSIKGYKSMLRCDRERAKALGDLVVKNTYRTLMTRGMKGCYVYCVDPALAARLRGQQSAEPTVFGYRS